MFFTYHLWVMGSNPPWFYMIFFYVELSFLCLLWTLDTISNMNQTDIASVKIVAIKIIRSPVWVVNHNSKIDLPLVRVVDIRLRYVKMYFTYAQSVFVIWARVPKTGNKKFFLFWRKNPAETCCFGGVILSIQLNWQLLKDMQKKVQEWLL